MKTDPQETELAALRQWLDDNEAAYLEAMSILDDPKKVLAWLSAFASKAQDIMRFDHFTHDAMAAIGTVSAARERFAGVFDDIDFIRDYVEKKERFKSSLRAIGGIVDELPTGASDL